MIRIVLGVGGLAAVGWLAWAYRAFAGAIGFDTQPGPPKP